MKPERVRGVTVAMVKYFLSVVYFGFGTKKCAPVPCLEDYSISVSLDGKNWGEPVLKGTFENNQKEKKVLFDQPVKARYIRFTALSEQRGQDFASGAELVILAD